MAQKVVWSYEAADDLEALAEYIGRDSTFYAVAFVQEIIDISRSLAIFPKRGRTVPELDHSEIRELFVKEYRLIYKIEQSRIVMLGLIHGKRNLPKLWKIENRKPKI